MEKARVGIVGTGHGLRTVLPALLSTGSFEISAVSGSTKERARHYVDQLDAEIEAMDFSEILKFSDDFDLLCIASPNQFHLDDFCKAAETSTNLYIEKPVGNSLSEASVIHEALANRSDGNFTVVGHQLRFNPFIREIRRQWRAGEIGRVYSLTISQRAAGFSSSDRPWTWEFEKSRGGGVRLAMGTHLLDLVNYLSDASVEEVFFNMDAVHEERKPDGSEQTFNVDVCNSFAASIDEGSFYADVSTSAASHGPAKFEIEVLGSHGALYYDGFAGLKAFRSGVEIEEPLNEQVGEEYLSQPGGSIFRKSLCKMAGEMAAQIHGHKNCLEDAATVSEALELMKVLDRGLSDRNSRFEGRKTLF